MSNIDFFDNENQHSLILAAEECDENQFEQIHTFSSFEIKIIKNLVAHGPVLLRGGRGCGKSALLIEANRLLKSTNTALGIYLSLRYLPLLRNNGIKYEEIFCKLVADKVNSELNTQQLAIPSTSHPRDAGELRLFLSEVATRTQKRLVLFFDDAAHIGRENSLSEFFDIFRTISSSLISCKAAIYPGVTNFGTRFDVYNDATVIDVTRDERSPDFADFFTKVLESRFPELYKKIAASNKRDIAAFLGRTVVGNMRAFVFASSFLNSENKYGLPELRNVLVKLATDYYWPLLEEVAPKLGKYQPLVSPCTDLAEVLFAHCGEAGSQSIIIHKDIIQKYLKIFEIQEYIGFISKREASRAMKSGGRGPRYSLNLACLLEKTPKAQLTHDFYQSWKESNSDNKDSSEVHSSNQIIKIDLPTLEDETSLGVFDLETIKLKKSNAYPYGLTESKAEILQEKGYSRISQLIEATDEEILKIDGIGIKTLQKIRAVIDQAIWL